VYFIAQSNRFSNKNSLYLLLPIYLLCLFHLHNDQVYVLSCKERMEIAKQRRPRRRAVIARDQILAAARVRLVRYGPDGLRLAEIAHDIGTTHPSILHHFGSRAGLVSALVEDAMQRLQTSLLALINQADSGGVGLIALIEQAYTLFQEDGTALFIQWAMMEEPELVMPTIAKHLTALVEVTHTARLGVLPKNTPINADRLRADTNRLVFIGALFVMGDALMGDWLQPALRLDKGERVQARALFGRLMLARMLEAVPRSVDARHTPTHIEN
jgi:AcrR family transcriptional regulator